MASSTPTTPCRVTVGDGETRPGLDATLQAGGWFTAMLLDANGAPLDGICINPVSVATNNWDGGQRSPAQGGSRPARCETDALLPGQYRIHFKDCSGRARADRAGIPRARRRRASSRSRTTARSSTSPAPPSTSATITLSRARASPAPCTTTPARRSAASASAVESQNWNWVGGGWTGPDGSYITDPLLPGNLGHLTSRTAASSAR